MIIRSCPHLAADDHPIMLRTGRLCAPGSAVCGMMRA
jgi:hypothetical protein